ncbi:MAG: hypothetical protein HY236_06390 [Acidobacteria bacterium]|nr:hypothetical protein [Acidobacteriota bacterium]
MATPAGLKSAGGPSATLPSLKVTVPVGVPEPLTVPVKVTDWAKTDGFCEEVKVIAARDLSPVSTRLMVRDPLPLMLTCSCMLWMAVKSAPLPDVITKLENGKTRSLEKGVGIREIDEDPAALLTVIIRVD